MADIGTAYVKIEPTAKGISGKIEQELGGAGASGGAAFNKGFGSVIGGVGKVVSGAVVSGTAALGAFAATSISAGATFDSSMAQVAATMGTTVDQIGDLRNFAQEMGSTTAFSATEAADALNYMALAGYDAETSMKMLPNVLNLAAAGGIDLASASDMITDAQTALGLSLDETSTMVDQMAKTSSKSNTSVAQLGEAFLTIGANARNVKGGTQELSTVLGVLADNGIKGSEAGTHLRNIMLALNPTTDKAAAAWEQLGVQAYDAEGNMRSLPDVFQELNDAMDGWSTQDRTEMLSAMFNKTDLASINALLGTTGDRYDELAAAIDNAGGAAEAMANTQLDNLSGDVTLFKSALEGAQIAVSDQLTPTLREFVQFGADGLSQLTQSFKEGGLEGAMATFGDLLSQLLAKITSMLPDMINAGMELLGALGQGLLENLPMIIDAAVQILNELVIGLIQALPSLAEGAIQILTGLINGIIQALPTVIPLLVQGLISTLPILIQGLVQLAVGLAAALPEVIVALIEALPTLITQIVTALLENLPVLIDGVTQLVIELAAHLPEIVMAIIEAIPQIITSVAEAIITNGPTILNSVIQLGQTILQNVLQFGQTLLSNVTTFFTNLLTNVKQWLAQLPQQAAYFVGKMVADFMNKLAVLPSKVQQIWTNIITNIKAFGTNLIQAGVNMVREFADKFINGFKELPGKLADIGRDIVEGLKNGIKNAWNGMTDWVKDLASNLIQGFKDNLKIGSPSKVFRDEIGYWIPAGIAEGIERGMDTINGAMTDMTLAVSPTAIGTIQPYTPQITATNNGTGSLYELLSYYLPIIASGENVNVQLDVDGQRLFRVIQQQQARNTQLVGVGANA